MPSTVELNRPRIDPRFRRRRVEVRRVEGRRRLRVAVMALTLLGIGVAGWGVTRSALLDVDRIRIVGAEETRPSAVRAAAGIDRGDPMTDVEEDVAARRVARLPWVASAEVRREWPGTVVVEIKERRAVAAVRADGGGWMLVDRTGRLLERTPLPPESLVALEATPPAGPPGGRLDRAATGALDVGAQIPSDRVGRLRVVALLPDGTLELRLVPEGIVHFGPPTQVGPKLDAVLTVLDQVDLRRLLVLDVRVPSAPVLTRRP